MKMPISWHFHSIIILFIYILLLYALDYSSEPYQKISEIKVNIEFGIDSIRKIHLRIREIKRKFNKF